MSDEKPNPFTIIKHHGEPQEAYFEYVVRLHNGKAEKRSVKVFRQDKIFVDIWGVVPCMPYDDHFVFEVPPRHQTFGMWTLWCTCGSMAGIANPENEATKMVVCNFYHSRLYEDGYGYHQTSVIDKDSFDKIAGQTIELKKGRRWLI